jgi:surface protein
MLALAALLLTSLVPASAAGQSPFVTTWETTSSSESITIPTESSGRTYYNFRIDWGDGTTERVTGFDPDPSHMYTAAGTYQVKIEASQAREAFPRIYLDAASLGSGSESNAKKLQSIDQWGDIQWESMEAAFAGAENRTYSATDNPDLAGVTNMRYMFNSTTAFNGDISGWDVSSVTDMRYMFLGATSFNQDLSTWDVSRVTEMDGMFQGATAFNQDLNAWNVSSVTDMGVMFADATVFNGDISSWDVSSVTNMAVMFSGADAFNNDISSWDVSGVIHMAGMFGGATSFNQDLGNWDVSSVTEMGGTFQRAAAFDQDLSAWDVSNVTNMAGMFDGATAFNGDISSWDVSSVTNMSSMFAGTTSFNQDLSAWDVSSVSNMVDMFNGATAFDQDLGSWDVSDVDDSVSFRNSFEDMFDGSGLSAQNYDRTLIGWSRLDLLQNATFGASGLAYCDAGPFRTYLQDEFGWTINDDGQASGCPIDLTAGANTTSSSDGSVVLTSGVRVGFDLSSNSGSGEVALGRFSEAPRNVGGIPESSVSSYRLVLVASPDLSFDGTTEVRFTASEFPGTPAPGEVTVYRRPVPGEGDFTALPTSYEASSGEIVAEAGSAGEPGRLGELVFASSSNPLPVELARFEGAVVEGQGAAESAVRLRWATASEESNTGFQVQRRAEGGSWTDLQFVEGAGTTSEPQTYRFTDADLPYAADSLRYRLKQVDTGGTTSLTDPITIGRGGPAGLELLGTAPNPASGQVTVRYGIPEATASEIGGSARLRLYDLLGRQVRSVRLGGSGTVAGRHKRGLDVSGLAPGTYVLRLEAGGQAATRKVTVVR